MLVQFGNNWIQKIPLTAKLDSACGLVQQFWLSSEFFSSNYFQIGQHVVLLHILITMFLTTFRRFPKIFQNCSEGLTNVSELFRTFSEDCRRQPKISEEVPMMFRSYNSTSEYFFSDYVAIAMAILRLVTTCYFHVRRYHVISTCEDIIFNKQIPC